MAKREIPEINAGSMADIAFLLLIFFLVTTTIDTDSGLIRKLPPKLDEEQPKPPPIKQRNIMEILINANDQLLVEGEYIQVTELREKAKAFIVSDPSNPDMPEFLNTPVPVLGTYPVSKQIISLQNDNGTSYKMYIKVQNELVGAYKEVRNAFAMKKFQKSYDDLVLLAESSESLDAKKDAVRKIYPQRISEAEPKKIGGTE